MSNLSEIESVFKNHLQHELKTFLLQDNRATQIPNNAIFEMYNRTGMGTDFLIVEEAAMNEQKQIDGIFPFHS